MLTPLALRVISRIRCLNRSSDFGAIVRLMSGPAVKLNPRNFRSCGRATALFITQKLKLKVNEAKSAVARPQERKFLGFSFTAGPDIKRTIAPKSLERFKQRIRETTRRAKGVSIKTTMAELAKYMCGWRGYFASAKRPRC